jgi:hypothetical protein
MEEADQCAALNIRVAPHDMEVPLTASPPAPTSRAGSARAMRPERSGGLPEGYERQLEEAGDEAERVGYFGEERRRVKVGERPSSARARAPLRGLQPAPPRPATGSQSARETLGPRGRRVGRRSSAARGH